MSWSSTVDVRNILNNPPNTFCYYGAMNLSFRPLQIVDFQLFADWLARPHVQRWWPEPATIEHVSKEYGDCTRGNFTTRVYVVEDGTRPIGIIQAFWLDDFPDHSHLFPMRNAVSIDYLIGEEDYVGRGVGAKMISQFIESVVKDIYPKASGIATSAEVENHASLGTLRKCGFTPGEVIAGEFGPERVMLLPF